MTPTRHAPRFSLLLTPMILLAGCANAFINGGAMATQDHATGARAAYRVASCTQIDNNSKIEAPTSLTYHLVDVNGKAGLFERDEKGKGVVIDNHWSDAGADHYYVNVTSNGWEYVFPQGGGAATRLVYRGVKSDKQADGTLRPKTQPYARCELAAMTK